jgi:hypothetical protein
MALITRMNFLEVIQHVVNLRDVNCTCHALWPEVKGSCCICAMTAGVVVCSCKVIVLSSTKKREKQEAEPGTCESRTWH